MHSAALCEMRWALLVFVKLIVRFSPWELFIFWSRLSCRCLTVQKIETKQTGSRFVYELSEKPVHRSRIHKKTPIDDARSPAPVTGSAEVTAPPFGNSLLPPYCFVVADVDGAWDGSLVTFWLVVIMGGRAVVSGEVVVGGWLVIGAIAGQSLEWVRGRKLQYVVSFAET